MPDLQSPLGSAGSPARRRVLFRSETWRPLLVTGILLAGPSGLTFAADPPAAAPQLLPSQEVAESGLGFAERQSEAEPVPPAPPAEEPVQVLLSPPVTAQATQLPPVQIAPPVQNAPPRLAQVPPAPRGTGAADPFADNDTARPIDPATEFKPIGKLTISYRPQSDYLPEDLAAETLAQEPVQYAPQEPLDGPPCPTPYGVIDGFCYNPLYFEQPCFERYGQSYGCLLVDSFVSAGMFYATIPTLPYQMTVKPPCSWECPICRENHCRHRSVQDLDPAGVAVEAAVIAGLILLIP